MLKPLVIYGGLSVKVTEHSDGPTLTVEHLESHCQQEHSTPSQVYTKLLLVLTTLHSHLLGMARSCIIYARIQHCVKVIMTFENLCCMDKMLVSSTKCAKV